MKVIIIDGYVDEPTCLGVPPFISTYIRYVAGALKLSGINDISYITIDSLRENNFTLKDKYDYGIIICGNPVPGKYLGGTPINTDEISKIAIHNKKTFFFIGGPIQFENFTINNENILLVQKDIESFIYDYFYLSKINFRYRTIEEINKFAISGSFIVLYHPRYPDIIIEIETGRGCPRKNHCSFCIEGLYNIEFREPEDVINEIFTLSKLGIKNFRIGKQPDLYSYKSNLEIYKNGFPKPNPTALFKLYDGIRSKVSDINVLHLDNVNPGTIVNFPDESIEITKTIVKYNTPGDTAPLGMESADPLVIQKNFLKCQPDEILNAIEIINSFGNITENTEFDNIPKLLPGINLIHGLLGESKETFKMNYEFLLKVMNKNLLLRRINIRQIHITEKVYLKEHYKKDPKKEKILDAFFKKYRLLIRNNIDHIMLKKIFPQGTILKNVIVESHRGDWSLARQLGSYSPIINIPVKLPILSKHNVFIIDHRERSLVGLLYPFNINNASLLELKQIPEISNKASEIFLSKNKIDYFKNKNIFEKIKKCIIF